jgi:CRISPR-associated protein Csm3
MQLNNMHTLEATIELVTGLHIGAGSEEMHIGGIDNAVLKHPHTLEPYIPGSSLKGKMRSLLEWRAGVVGECGGKPVNGKVLGTLQGEKLVAAEQIAKLFGLSGDSDNVELARRIGPTRVSFWDCSLDNAWSAGVKDKGQLYTEAKSENMIDRIKGVAEHPRQTERVPAGARFVFKLTFKELDGDSQLLETLLAGLKLLELDGIGGSGSRGYGKIRFDGLTLDGESIQEKLQATQPFKKVA